MLKEILRLESMFSIHINFLATFSLYKIMLINVFFFYMKKGAEFKGYKFVDRNIVFAKVVQGQYTKIVDSCFIKVFVIYFPSFYIVCLNRFYWQILLMYILVFLTYWCDCCAEHHVIKMIILFIWNSLHFIMKRSC